MLMLTSQQNIELDKSARILERLRAEYPLNGLLSIIEVLDESFGQEPSAFRLCFEFVYGVTPGGDDDDLGRLWMPLDRVTREDVIEPFEFAADVDLEVAQVAAWVFHQLFQDAGVKSPLADKEWLQMLPDWGLGTFG